MQYHHTVFTQGTVGHVLRAHPAAVRRCRNALKPLFLLGLCGSDIHHAAVFCIRIVRRVLRQNCQVIAALARVIAGGNFYGCQNLMAFFKPARTGHRAIAAQPVLHRQPGCGLYRLPAQRHAFAVFGNIFPQQIFCNMIQIRILCQRLDCRLLCRHDIGIIRNANGKTGCRCTRFRKGDRSVLRAHTKRHFCLALCIGIIHHVRQINTPQILRRGRGAVNQAFFPLRKNALTDLLSVPILILQPVHGQLRLRLCLQCGELQVNAVHGALNVRTV